jgi:hypothetical protein
VRKTIAGLLPLAIGFAGLGLAIAWLLSHSMAPGVWLLAAVLFGHGSVHAMFLLPRPPKKVDAPADAPAWPFDMSMSWPVVRAGLPVSRVRALGAVLIAAVVVGWALAALATVGVAVPSVWWPGLVVAAAAGSALLLVIFFDPQLLLGLAIDAVLVWVAAAPIWIPNAG